MNTHATMAWMGAAALLMATQGALAQTSTKDDPKTTPATTAAPSTPPKKVRPVRKPVVDLDSMAKDRRPGQVMPGDPAPSGGQATRPISPGAPAPAGAVKDAAKPITPEMLEENASKPTIKLPDTAPYNKPVLHPAGDTRARPEVLNGVMPAPSVEVNAAEADRTKPDTEVAVPVKGSEVPATPVNSNPPEPAPEKMTEKPVEKNGERTQAAASTFAPIVDGVVMTQLANPLSVGGASVRVESISGDAAGVQWRVGNGPWTAPAAGQTAEGKVEIRAGLDGQVVLVVDGLADVRVTRLGRAVIERCTEPRGATSVGIGVTRGAVEVRPVGPALTSGGQMFARVKTPDQTFGLVGPLRVEYDAFAGTKRRSVNP